MARRFIRKWGKKAKVCKCRPDSVKIDMRWFHHVLPYREKKRKIKQNRKRSRKADVQLISYQIPSIGELNGMTNKHEKAIDQSPAKKSTKNTKITKGSTSSHDKNPAPAPLIPDIEQKIIENDNAMSQQNFFLLREELFSVPSNVENDQQ